MLLLTDSKGRLMLRRLDKTHPLYPGRWDIAGSGHVGAGEPPKRPPNAICPRSRENSWIVCATP
jgi:hypothetical protein